MQPTLFNLELLSGNWEVSAYAFFMMLACLIGVFGLGLFLRKSGLTWKKTSLVIFSILVAALIGARLLHLVVNWNLYQDRPERLWAFDTLGFSLYGGILFAALAGFLVTRYLKINYWQMGDNAMPFLGLSIALMRVGCYLNGCCFGKETNLPWGVTFPILSPAHKYQLSQHIGNFFSVVPVHPTELYELTAALLGSLIAWYGLRKKWKPGVVIIVFGLWFSAFRFFNYYLRVMPGTFDASPLFYPIFYLVFIIFCLGLLARRLGVTLLKIEGVK